MAAAYEVKNVTEEQEDDPGGSGDLIDMFIITFTIPGHSGDFVVKVPESGTPVTDAYDAISAKVDQVNAIYGGAAA